MHTRVTYDTCLLRGTKSTWMCQTRQVAQPRWLLWYILVPQSAVLALCNCAAVRTLRPAVVAEASSWRAFVSSSVALSNVPSVYCKTCYRASRPWQARGKHATGDGCDLRDGSWTGPAATQPQLRDPCERRCMASPDHTGILGIKAHVLGSPGRRWLIEISVSRT